MSDVEEVKPTRYTRPKGVMGGPCLHRFGSQPEHLNLTCDEVRAARSEVIKRQLAKAKEKPVSAPTIEQVRELLQTMIVSAEVFVQQEGPEQIITGYKIKTGALHKLIGLLSLHIPVNLPEAK